jgi:hypothetical protein
MSVIGRIARVTLLPLHRFKLRRFIRSLDTARDAQRETMLKRIRRSADTQFGREHGFAAIDNLRDYRRAVPISSYETISPYISKVIRGDRQALLPASEKVLALACTTGSAGSPKVLLVTRTWLKEYRKAWELWGVKAFLDHMDIIGTKWLQLSGPGEVSVAENGMPVGMVSAVTARFQNPIFKLFYATPTDTGDIESAFDRNYTILRLSLGWPVGFIMTITPANLIHLAEVGDENRESLIRDLFDGTLRRDIALAPAFRSSIEGRIRDPQPERARELEEIVERTGTLYPKDYWPLRLINCWLGGTVGYQSSRLADYYGDVATRDLGYVSTEGRHTIPLGDQSSDGVLYPYGAYYEFAAAEADRGRHRSTLEAHELEAGRDYSPIISTSNGLYRYDLGDVVRCKGYLGQAPILEFLHKTAQYSDMEGEKLSGHQVARAVDSAYRRLGLPHELVSALAIRGDNGASYYGILADSQSLGDDVMARRFVAALDEALSSMNLMYASKRRDRSIAPPRLMRLAPGSWSRHIEIAGRQRGTGDTQHKHPLLFQEGTWPEGIELIDVVRIDEPSLGGRRSSEATAPRAQSR